MVSACSGREEYLTQGKNHPLADSIDGRIIYNW